MGLNFRTIISGVFAYPLDASWLGKEVDATLIDKLLFLADKYGLSPSGEGGEIETHGSGCAPFQEKNRNSRLYC